MTVALRQWARCRLRASVVCASLWGCGAVLAAAPVDQPPTWSSLSTVQKQALAPLQRDWASVDTRRKQKWLEVASRYASMPRDEQDRIQARMTDWLQLSPNERASARLQFQELKQVPADERQERWRAYQALSPEERSRLVQEARPVSRQGPSADGPADPRHAPNGRSAARRMPGPGAAGKAAVAPTQPLLSPTTAWPNSPPNSTPIAVQARPGATTNTPLVRPAPPLHHQQGLPKIAATPGFVDPATLLPKRGPQGAAVRRAPAIEPAGSAARP